MGFLIIRRKITAMTFNSYKPRFIHILASILISLFIVSELSFNNSCLSYNGGGNMKAYELSFEHIVVDSDNPADPHCKTAADIDGDGYGDLLAASASGGGLFWYHYPDWTKHKIAGGTFTTDMTTGDVDGDGFLDVIIPSNEGLMWYRNPKGRGGDPTKDEWEAIKISPEGARMHDVEAADLDGDGKLDLVTRHQSGFGKKMGNQIHIWKQNSPRQWDHSVFDCPHGEGLKVADLNGDELPDVIIGGRWYENPGDILNGTWHEHLYMSSEHFDKNWTNGDVAVDAGDLSGNGRVDIVLSPAEGSGHLSWFEAPVDPRKPDWVEHVIELVYDHAHGVGIADMNGDGYPDIVVAKMHQATAPQEVAIYLNPGNADVWKKHVVATSGSHNIALFDVDGDGRIDIFGANWNNRSSTKGAIELWFNRTEK
jgi:hypothetical protein